MNDEKIQIPVAEHFYSVQGEGPNAGTPAVFLRLAGCNLTCGWDDDLEDYEPGDEPKGDASWVCDTIDVWRQSSMTPTPEELIDEWDTRGWWDKLIPGGAHLILTGGEPTLPARQDEILKLVAEILRRRKRGKPLIEVETNGTIVPKDELQDYVDLWNVSVKLSNSGMDKNRRLVDDALEFHAGNGNSVFKFVVSDKGDIDEVIEIIEKYSIPHDRVSLMPSGQTREQLAETYPIVAEVCKDRLWDFTPRLQVTTWGETTGV